MKAAGGGQRRCEGGRGQLGDAWGLCRDLVSQAEVGSFPLTHRVSLDKAAPQLSGHVCAGQMSKTPLWKFGNRRWGCQGVSKGWVAVPAEPCRALGGLRGPAPILQSPPETHPVLVRQAEAGGETSPCALEALVRCFCPLSANVSVCLGVGRTHRKRPAPKAQHGPSEELALSQGSQRLGASTARRRGSSGKKSTSGGL